MFVLDPGARFDFIHAPTPIWETFESVNANKHAVIGERCFNDRWDRRVGNQRLRASDRRIIVVMFRVIDEYASRPQEPRLDADFDTHTFGGAGERLFCRFWIVNGLPEPLWALKSAHVAR